MARKKETKLPSLTTLESIKEALDVRLGRRGDPLDRAVTLRELVENGMPFNLRRTGGNNFDLTFDDGEGGPVVERIPLGFHAFGVFGGISLIWDLPENFTQLAHTEIYRGTSATIEQRQFLSASGGTMHFDNLDDQDQTEYFYWIRYAFKNGRFSPFQGPVSATSLPLVTDIMGRLTEEIDSSHLAISLRDKIDSIIPIRDDLLGKVDGVRDDLILKSNELDLRIDGEVARLDAVEDNLSGPETVDGTVANRIAGERAARIAGLDAERDERVVAIQYEADARADAIQAEAQARGEQIFEVQTQLELEQGFFASQLDVVAAAYEANTATTYSLEEVRVTDSEATATRINGLEVEVEGNKASLVEEQTVRASETSALASHVSVLSAKLDALPTFANGFEAGVEFGRWTVPTGHTLVAENADTFQGDQAALIGSTEASVATGTVPFGVSIALATGTGDVFAGRRLRIGLAAKAVSGGSAEYAVGYATSDGWFSGWQTQTPPTLWGIQETLVDVPDTPGLDHYIVLWGDTSGGGGTVKVDRLLVDVANTEIPEITAQIETIQQAVVDTEQALTENITNMQSVYDTQITDIQNTQTTLATNTQTLAQDVQTLTVTTGDLAADIQFESTVRANETGALAQSVTDLWAGVGDTEGRITQEAETRAEEDYFRGLMQDVMQANVDTSAATITSIKEVVVEKDSVMARNVEAIEGRVEDAEGAVTDIMQLNIDPGSVLATRFSSIEGSVVDANAKITNIENLDIAEDSVLASRLSTIDGKISDAEAGVTDIETLNLSEDTALLTRFSSIDARIGTAEGEITQAADLIVERDRINGFIQDVISASTGVSSAVYRSITDVVVEKDSVVASKLDELAGDVGSANGRITNIENLNISEDSVLLTKLTALEVNLGAVGVSYDNIISLEVDETSAFGQRLETLGTAAQFTYDLANVSITGDGAPPLITRLIGVETDTSKAQIRIGTLEEDVGSIFSVKLEENGVIGGFGLTNQGKTVDAIFDVDTFALGRTYENPEGDSVRPFIYDGETDTVYIDTVMIRNGSIQEGQLGNITIGKLEYVDPADGIKKPVATLNGLLRAESIDADNLTVARAATFYSDVYSGSYDSSGTFNSNYSEGATGWRILQNGTVEFNEGTFNGTVEFKNVENKPLSFRVVAKGGLASSAPSPAMLSDENGDVIKSAGRSYNLSVLNRATRNWVSHTTFDVYGNGARASDLSSVLNSLGSDTIAVLYTNDEPKNNRLLHGLPDAIKRIGGSSLFTSPNFRHRGSYVLVGIPGSGEGNGLELYSGDFDSDPDSWIDTGFTVDPNGNIQLGRTGVRNALDINYADGTLVEDLKPASAGSTRNEVFRQNSTPTGAANGDIWIYTGVTPHTTRLRIGGTWVNSANLTTNTSQLTDGAKLGEKATWSSVSGNGRPSDNATRNNVYYTDYTPSGAVNGDIWVKGNGTNYIMVSGGWRDAGDVTANNTAADTVKVDGEWASNIKTNAAAGASAGLAVDFFSYVSNGNTYVDGGKIKADAAFVDSFFINDNAVTVPNEDTGSQVDGNGRWHRTIADVTIYLYDASPILLFWAFKHGYNGGSGQWGFAIDHNGAEIKLRTGMNAVTDYPSGAMEVNGVAGSNRFKLDWHGSDGDLDCTGTLVVMGAQR